MNFSSSKMILLLLYLFSTNCQNIYSQKQSQLNPGANNIDQYLPLIINKKVALVVNHTSLVDNTHLVDTLKKLGVNIVKIFAPEHGFRGDKEAGEFVETYFDKQTQIEVISLYGKKKKPTPSDLTNVDVIVYDIQDVGVRFFTYISTLLYIMEACAENNVKLIVLDRPNPNGDYISGPILDTSKFKSFVGLLPIPIVYGLTPAELAIFIKNEILFPKKIDLTIIKCQNYTHNKKYIPPVKPSPNLTTYNAIRLYPSLCLFEATSISIGRGTYEPFEVIGYPDSSFGKYSFIPEEIPNMAKNPLHKGKICFGEKIIDTNHRFTLYYVEKYYKICQQKNIQFFRNARWFDLLMGTDKVRLQILNNVPYSKIEQQWQDDLNKYKQKIQKYLIYPWL